MLITVLEMSLQMKPKKLVTDENGEEWEVIDKKKRVYIEYQEEEEGELIENNK